ncbi:MAG: DUF2059 domain-containing protein [Desulfuromonadales bacterium]|jgi:hypothetical protein
MRLLIVLLLALTWSVSVAGAETIPTTEAGKVREAELLVRLSLTDRVMTNVQDNYTNQLGAVLTAQEVPAEDAARLIDEEMQALADSEHQRLLDALVPIYRRYYTADEIHQLLSFYQTEVARKSFRVSGMIAAEAQQFVRLWNENFEQELLEQVKARLSEAGITIE